MSETGSYKAFDANALFQLLRDGKTHTRSDLAKTTGLARSTIGTRIDELLQLGLIAEVSRPTPSPGRPAVGFALNTEARVIIAADMGATDYKIAITNLVGAVLAQRSGKYAVADGPEPTLDLIVEVARELMAECKRSERELAAVGIGLPVPVIHETGLALNPTDMPAWEKFSVPDYLQAAFNVPVLVDNDANIMVLGERVLNWPDVDDFMLIKASTGIGSGIISNGQLQRGAEGTAGAIGHVPIARAQGVHCTCGKEGCLVAVAGGAAVAAALRSTGRDTATIDDVVALAQSGDLQATRAMRQAGRDIGEVISTCISLINPSVIAIAGTMTQAGAHLLAGVREAVFGQSMPLGSGNVSVVLSDRTQEIGLIGASMMAIEHALSDESFLALSSASRHPLPV